SVAVPSNIDDARPSVSVAVAPSGWVPRDGSTLQVSVTADDGSGSGPQSAALSFDGCSSCAVLSGLLAGNVFTFQVPRSVQTAGSETPVSFTVTVLDRAGNQATAQGSLQIDDAPPQIGSFTLVSAPKATGEDGKPWFSGGAS